MVHPGCGADIIRQRRRKDTLTKEQRKETLQKFKDNEESKKQLLEPFESIYQKNTFARAKNKRYHGHYTPARDSQVFNKQRCSTLRINAIRQDVAKSSPKSKRGTARKLSRHHSVVVNNVSSIKNQDNLQKSKSLEQEAPPQTPPLHRACRAMEVKGDQIAFGSTSVKGTDSKSTTVESLSTDVSKDPARIPPLSTTRQNNETPFSYVSADYERLGPASEKGSGQRANTEENKKFKNPLKCIICNPTCLWFRFKPKAKSEQLPPVLNSITKKNDLNDSKCSISTHLMSDDKTCDTTSDENLIGTKLKEKERILEDSDCTSVKKAFRILCICSLRCSRYRCVSGSNADSGKAKDKDCDTNGSIFDITLEDIHEEDCSFYMDIPLDIAVFSEFNDTKKAQKNS